MLNTMQNPMNPGFDNYDGYLKYRNILKKIKALEVLDGLDINSLKALEPYKKDNSEKIKDEKADVITLDESEIYNLIKQKKRQSTITFSQRMLKKADNLTNFNRKNHSEGNKHITNNDL
jgi:hypothetical protein